MEFWQSLALTEVDQLVELARIAEEVGFTGVTVADHLVTPRSIESRYPYDEDGRPSWQADDPFPDPWIAISAMARETRSLRFMPYVYVLTLREPLHVAKALSSAAVLSDDRVVLGAGVGWMREEFELTGQPFEARGRRADEMVEVIRKLMTGEPVRHEGEFYRFDAVQMSPAPARPVEVRFGGHSRAALRRAARHDGWIAVTLSAEQVRARVDFLREERARLGRRDTPFDVMVTHFPDPSDSDPFARYREAGVTSIHVPPWRYRGMGGVDLGEKRRSLEAFAERYIARPSP